MEQKGKSKAKMGEGKECRSRGSKPRAGRESKGVYTAHNDGPSGLILSQSDWCGSFWLPHK